MKAMRQRTFKVGNEKVTIKSTPRTYTGNFCGWYVWINDKKYFCNILEREKAIDHTYSKWVKSKVMNNKGYIDTWQLLGLLYFASMLAVMVIVAIIF